MAIVQFATGVVTGGTAISATLNGVTAGNLLVIQLSYFYDGQLGGAAAPAAPAGWTPAPNQPTTQTYGTSSVGVAHYIRSGVAGGTHNVSITLPAGSYGGMTLSEWPAADYPHPCSFDQESYSGGNTIPTTSMTAGPTGTTTTAKQLVLATIDADNTSGSADTGLTSATSGYSSLHRIANVSVNEALDHSYKEVTSTGTQTANWTTSSYGATQAWKAGVVTITGSSATPPTITAQPQNQTANVGGTNPTFSVTATGGTLTYQWQDNSSGSFADISGATSSSYSPTVTFAMQGRQYRCNVTDANGTTTSNAATLTVAFNVSGTGPKAAPPFAAGPFASGPFDAVLQAAVPTGGTNNLTATANAVATLVATLSVAKNLSASLTSQATFSSSFGIFPLSVHASGRYLVDATGRPFLFHGDTAWSLPAALNDAEIDQYVDDRYAKGFNAVLIEAPVIYFTPTGSTNNVSGNAPFTDMTGNWNWVLNNAYWSRVDRLVNRCKLYGMVVVINPAYLGFNTTEGCQTQVSGSADATLFAYGVALANRYTQGNVIWSFGGDMDPDATLRAKQWQIALGIRSIRTTDLMTAHGAPGEPGYTTWNGQAGFNLNNSYPGDVAEVFAENAIEYARSGPIPFLMFEAIYEQERASPISAAGLRRQSYQSFLSGACGQFFGNSPIWHFGSPNAPFSYTGTWQTNLNSTGSVQQQYVKQLFNAYEWWKLEPKTDASLVSTSLSSGTTRICPARASDGSFGMVWVPSAQSVTVVMTNFVGQVRARHYDPTNGTYTLIGTYANTGSQSIAVPGEGVLVLDNRVELAASLPVQTTVTSSLQKSIALVATAASAATFSGNASLSTALNVSMSAVAALSSSLLKNVSLSASLAGTSVLTSSASLATALTAALGSSTSVTSDLTVAKLLSLSMGAISTVTASASVGTGFAASLATSSTLSAAPTVLKPLDAALAAASTATFSVTIARPLSAALSSTSTVTGDATVLRALTAALASQATVTASAGMFSGFAANLGAIATVTAAPAVLKPLTASLGSVVSMTGTFGAAVALQANLGVESAIAATLLRNVLLNAGLSSSASVSGSMTAGLTASMASFSTLLASTTAGLTAALSVQSSSSANATVLRALQAALQAQAALTANTGVNLPLSAALQAVSTLSGAASLSTGLVAALQANPSLAANLTKLVNLSIQMSADSSSSGNLSITRFITALLQSNTVLGALLSGGQLVNVTKQFIAFAPKRIRSVIAPTRKRSN